jgi:hypothetical protein
MLYTDRTTKYKMQALKDGPQTYLPGSKVVYCYQKLSASRRSPYASKPASPSAVITLSVEMEVVEPSEMSEPTSHNELLYIREDFIECICEFDVEHMEMST